MTTNEKQNKQPTDEERKKLTPQQIQTRKKMVIFPLFFLVFAGCMWREFLALHALRLFILFLVCRHN